MVSDDILPTIYQPMGGVFDPETQMWVIAANLAVSKVPKVVLPVGNIDVELYLPDMLHSSVNESWVSGSIQSRKNATADIFGDKWLRNVYAIFDYKGTGTGPRLGVVTRMPAPTTSSAIIPTGSNTPPKKSDAGKTIGYNSALCIAIGIAIGLCYGV